MSALYLETSAILAWLFGEKQFDKIRSAVDGAEVVVTSSLAFAESDRALVRAESTRLIRVADAQRLRGMLQRARSGWMSMALPDLTMVSFDRRILDHAEALGIVIRG
jgi:uncharacterized protein with PIN domain